MPVYDDLLDARSHEIMRNKGVSGATLTTCDVEIIALRVADILEKRQSNRDAKRNKAIADSRAELFMRHPDLVLTQIGKHE